MSESDIEDDNPCNSCALYCLDCVIVGKIPPCELKIKNEKDIS